MQDVHQHLSNSLKFPSAGEMGAFKIYLLFLVATLFTESVCVAPNNNQNAKGAKKPAVMFPRINPSTTSSRGSLPNSLPVGQLQPNSGPRASNIVAEGHVLQGTLHTGQALQQPRQGVVVPTGTDHTSSQRSTQLAVNTQDGNIQRVIQSNSESRVITETGLPPEMATNIIRTTNNMGVPAQPNLPSQGGPVLATVTQGSMAATATGITTDESEILNQKKPTNKKICKSKDHRRCFIYINEVLPSKRTKTTYTADQFIEIVRTCRRSAVLTRKDILDGNIILIVDLLRKGERSAFNGNLVFYSDLHGKQMTTRPEEAQNDGVNWYYTVGTLDGCNTKLSAAGFPVQHLSGRIEGFKNAVPSEDNFPKMVMLLHMNKNEQTTRFFAQFNLNKHLIENRMLPRHVTPELLQLIKTRVIDMFVYGRECSSADAEIIKRYYPSFPSDCSDFIMTSDTTVSGSPVSYSKCMDDEPFNVNTFQTALATPGYKNSCQVKPVVTEEPDSATVAPFSPPDGFYPFSFKKRILQSQSQKLILNLWSSLKKVKLYPQILDGFPQDVASKLTGVSPRTMQRASRRHRDNVISTPGKKRKPSACSVIVKLDSFDLEKIRKLLREGYAAGRSLTASEVREKFLKYKLDEYEALRNTQHTDPEITVPDRPFTCSLNTFRRVLRLLGFRFRTIDQRAKIMQRADLIGWRGKYLRRLRKNRAAAKPKKLVYIDETWIDPHLRTSKGWIPATSHLKKDMALYTYGTMKIGKGPRLIVLSAICEDGMIAESVFVEKVSKSQSELEDYHKNINAQKFTKWFTDLLNTLDKKKQQTGDEYLIIMDNASYHSSRLHPKKSDTKKTMYDWLKSLESIDGLDVSLPEFKNIRKWELQIMIDEVIVNPLMEGELYSIDKMAKDRGFEILRLAPYHCHFSPIEYSWKDVKHNTRKQNTMQNLDLVKAIVEKELKEYNPELAKKHFGHVIRLEEETWEADGLFEEAEVLNRIVIPVDDESSSDGDGDQQTEQTIVDDEPLDENEDYLDWANDVLQVVLEDTDERIETDGTMYLREECDYPNDEYDIENEMGRYMNQNPKRYRSEPLMISRILNAEATDDN